MSSPLEGPAYVQYQYGYPHKTAYRTFGAPLPLGEVWAHENKNALSLYVHVPFCEMRCGFCNLFTVAGPLEVAMERFVVTLEREAAVVRSVLGDATFSRVAIGGGTPSILPVPLLERVLKVVTTSVRTGEVPFGVEVSPETVTPDRIATLRSAGVDRFSIGVQSFLERETKLLARPQSSAVVRAALDLLRGSGVETLNIDLIYGIEDQTIDTFLESIRTALKWKPEELYLYPLYVRPRTFLGKSTRAWDDFRLELYRAGRALLLSEGYAQVSMRCFRASHAPLSADAPAYRCQEDGMLGLGVGARSYTSGLHYSSEWAVSPKAVRGIIDSYAERSDASFAEVQHGIQLDEAEQRRRFLILSLLADGLDGNAYRAAFRREAGDDFAAELNTLVQLGLATSEDGRWSLTDQGLERSDAVGPWLQSQPVTAKMKDYDVR